MWKIFLGALLCICVSFAVPRAHAIESSRGGSAETAIDLQKVIQAVAKKTGKKFVVDPRVRAEVNLAGVDPPNVSYAELLSILSVYMFSAVEYGGFVRIVPLADIRTLPIPTMVEGRQYLDDEYVSKVVVVKSVPAVSVLQVLRPTMPQYAHIGVIPCVNSIVLVDSYANVKRLLTLIAALDRGEPYNPGKCMPDEPKK